MAKRIANTVIVTGHGESRREIQPGEEFDPAGFGISDEELNAMEAQQPPAVRSVPVQPQARPGDVAVVDEPREGRSGPVSDATSGADAGRDAKAEDVSGSRPSTSRKTGDLDGL